MDLFVRESGPVDAPAIVFLHGGHMSGWSWEPVVERMQRYRCLVPDLPQVRQELRAGTIRDGPSRRCGGRTHPLPGGTGRAHWWAFRSGPRWGFNCWRPSQNSSIGRCCAAPSSTRCRVYGSRGPAGAARPEQMVPVGSNQPPLEMHGTRIPRPRSMATARMHASIRARSSPTSSWRPRGSLFPRDSTNRIRPHCSSPAPRSCSFVRRWAAALAQSMPNGVDRVAIGMGHDWPLRYPDLFSRTVDGWLSRTALPPEIGLPT